MSDTGNKENVGSLAHLIYLCPGLHGKESKQVIKRKTFREFFKENGRLIIPLFQRRYCWTDKTVWHWFEDVVRGKRDHLGIHNSGNVIVKKSAHNEGLIIIDGQQRVTTTMLLLSTLKDELMKIEKQNLENLDSRSRQTFVKCQRELKTIIFLDGGDCSDLDLERSDFDEGQDFTACRLLPSFCDRKSFFDLMISPAIQSKDNEEISYQCRAKEIFRSRIAQEIAEQHISSDNSKVEWLSEAIHQALNLMGITYVEIVNDINMAQVFLWLQEKSLLGEAALLANPTPGNYFTAVDMVRNLMLSPTMDQSIEEQEHFYRKYWLEPVESNFSGHHQLDRFNETLSRFIKMKTQNTKHVSVAESTYIKMMKASTSISPKGKEYINTYAKCISLYEKVSKDIMEKQEIKSQISLETEEPTIEIMQKASVSISSEFAKFLTRTNLEEIRKSETWE